eukprot:13576358-Alexandrium_andersonii.AAC.1
MAVLRRHRPEGWRIRTASAHTAAVAMLLWKEIYVRVACGILQLAATLGNEVWRQRAGVPIGGL